VNDESAIFYEIHNLYPIIITVGNLFVVFRCDGNDVNERKEIHGLSYCEIRNFNFNELL